MFKAIAMIQQRLHKGYRNINTVNSAIGKNFIKNRCPVLFRYWTEYAGSIWKSSDIHQRCVPRLEELELLKGRSTYIFTAARPPTAGCEKLACKRISITAFLNPKIKFSVFEKSLYSGNALPNSAMNICASAEFKNFHTIPAYNVRAN